MSTPPWAMCYALAAHLRRRAHVGIGQAVLTEAQPLAQQSNITKIHLTLVNRASTYTHNDPGRSYPNSVFYQNLVPFLNKVDAK